MPRVQVDYQGNVTLLTQAIYMSKCMVDVTYYPFDMQVQYSTVQSTVQYPLPLRHAAVRAQVRLLDHRGDQGECRVIVRIILSPPSECMQQN